VQWKTFVDPPYKCSIAVAFASSRALSSRSLWLYRFDWKRSLAPAGAERWLLLPMSTVDNSEIPQQPVERLSLLSIEWIFVGRLLRLTGRTTWFLVFCDAAPTYLLRDSSLLRKQSWQTTPVRAATLQQYIIWWRICIRAINWLSLATILYQTTCIRSHKWFGRLSDHYQQLLVAPPESTVPLTDNITVYCKASRFPTIQWIYPSLTDEIRLGDPQYISDQLDDAYLKLAY